jgi:hypothetical protein
MCIRDSFILLTMFQFWRRFYSSIEKLVMDSRPEFIEVSSFSVQVCHF